MVPTDGYAYYDTSSKLFYIDAAYDGTVISRQPINADNAVNGMFYGTCATAQSTKAKIAILTNSKGFTLKEGIIILIKFTNASAASTMTLAIQDNKGNTIGAAKNLYQYGTTLMSSGTTNTGWAAGALVPFVYNGTGWERFYWANTLNTAGSTDTTSKIFLIGATSQGANPQTYSDSEIYVTNGTLYAVKTTEASGTANNKPALIVGGTDTTAHLELDANELMAKSNGTTTTALYLNNDGGLVYANNKKVVRLTSDSEDGQIMIADGADGQIKSSGYTIVNTVPSASSTSATIPSSTAIWAAISGASGYGKTGTVTSVQVQATAPIVSSSSDAATTSLNTTISLAATSANYVIAGPSSGTATAVPTYRKLVAADIPDLTKSKISDFPTNISAFTNDSGYVTSSGVTDVTFNTSNSTIYKTINGTTSSIVEIPILAGSGNNSAYGGGAIEPSKAVAFAFGSSAEANGVNSIALGGSSKANSTHSISLGLSSSTTGARSIAIGYAASTSGTDAIAIGSGTLANGAKQMALGCYNIADTSSTYCLIVGNGTADDARSNAMTVDYNGNLDVTGDIKANNITNNTISASSTSATIPTSDAVWAAITGASGYGKVGTVTSVQIQATTPIVSSNSASTSTSLSTTISLANAYGDTKNPYGTKTANYVLAGPSSGSAAVPTFRELVVADLPATYYANIQTTSAATYNTAPEMATLKLNGNTSATAASTSNVTLVYDTILQALNFVFA